MEGRQRGLVGAVTTRGAAVGRWFLDALFPDFCGGCGREGTIACETCWSLLPLEAGARRLDGIDAWSVTRYQAPVVRGVVHALKYGRRPAAAERMREAIRRWPDLGAVGATPWRLVPVPMHPSRRRRRGTDHARRLADMLAACGLGPVEPLLRRTRRTGSQTALDREARQENVRGAFASSGADPDASYLLVDDVVTSGATLAAAAEALRSAGARRVAAWTFAAD